ncbi:hypothetical protein MD484_g761, partial [Candolleomyces efflorescens]
MRVTSPVHLCSVLIVSLDSHAEYDYVDSDPVNTDPTSSTADDLTAETAKSLPMSVQDVYLPCEVGFTDAIAGPYGEDPSSIEWTNQVMLDTYVNGLYVQDEARRETSSVESSEGDLLLAATLNEMNTNAMQYPLPYVPGSYDINWTSYNAASRVGEDRHSLDGGLSELGLAPTAISSTFNDGLYYAYAGEGPIQATYGHGPDADLWLF